MKRGHRILLWFLPIFLYRTHVLLAYLLEMLTAARLNTRLRQTMVSGLRLVLGLGTRIEDPVLLWPFGPRGWIAKVDGRTDGARRGLLKPQNGGVGVSQVSSGEGSSLPHENQLIWAPSIRIVLTSIQYRSPYSGSD